MYLDIVGPFAETILFSGGKYYILLTDWYTNYRWLGILPRRGKEILISTVKMLLADARKTVPRKRIFWINIIADNEFRYIKISNEILDARVLWEFCAPYYHEQNSRAEISNQIITIRMNTMLCGSTLPLQLWGEAANYAVQVTNRLPTKSNPCKMLPYEMLFNKSLRLENLKT